MKCQRKDSIPSLPSSVLFFRISGLIVVAIPRIGIKMQVCRALPTSMNNIFWAADTVLVCCPGRCQSREDTGSRVGARKLREWYARGRRCQVCPECGPVTSRCPGTCRHLRRGPTILCIRNIWLCHTWGMWGSKRPVKERGLEHRSLNWCQRGTRFGSLLRGLRLRCEKVRT